MAELIDAIYPELKRLAHFQLAGERHDHTLNTTAIVHEAYLRMATADSVWKDRQHFYGPLRRSCDTCSWIMRADATRPSEATGMRHCRWRKIGS